MATREEHLRGSEPQTRERDARRALLARLIDHAPLFPPASLPLDEALADHDAACRGADAWLLNRLVWPASRLAELGEGTERLSLVLDVPVEKVVARSREVEAVELRWRRDLGALTGIAAEVFVELPLDESVSARIAELAGLGLRAKVRCGGEGIPSIEQLAGFVRACRAAGLPFKATAGLHHALPTNGEHGLVNLLAAAVFGDEERALAETDPGAFALAEDAFRWRDREAEPGTLLGVRRDLLVSVGSCSFAEPVAELRAHGLL